MQQARSDSWGHHSRHSGSSTLALESCFGDKPKPQSTCYFALYTTTFPGSVSFFSAPLQVPGELGVCRIEVEVQLPRVVVVDLVDGPHPVKLEEPLADLPVRLEVVGGVGHPRQGLHQVRQEGLELVNGPLLQLDRVHRRDEVLDGFGDGHGVRSLVGTALHRLRDAHLQKPLPRPRTVHVVQGHEGLRRRLVPQNPLGELELGDQFLALGRVLLRGQGVTCVRPLQVLRRQDDGVQVGLVVHQFPLPASLVQRNLVLEVAAVAVHDNGMLQYDRLD